MNKKIVIIGIGVCEVHTKPLTKIQKIVSKLFGMISEGCKRQFIVEILLDDSTDLSIGDVIKTKLGKWKVIPRSKEKDIPETHLDYVYKGMYFYLESEWIFHRSKHISLLEMHPYNMKFLWDEEQRRKDFIEWMDAKKIKYKIKKNGKIVPNYDTVPHYLKETYLNKLKTLLYEPK